MEHCQSLISDFQKLNTAIFGGYVRLLDVTRGYAYIVARQAVPIINT